MNISVDGGALCADSDKKYGNYRFSSEILGALSKCDKENNYKIYTFCDEVIGKNNTNFQYKKIIPSTGFMPYRVGVEEFMFGGDIFLSLNQAIPSYTRGKVIAFSHGLAFHYFWKLYPDSYKFLYHQLEEMIKRADIIVVSSKKVKKEFKEIAPNFNNIVVIPFGISDVQTQNPELGTQNFFLYVGMDHPIKQIDEIINSFLSVKKNLGGNDWKLVLVGVSEKYQEVENEIKVIPFAKPDELIKLYQNASYLVTASLYESFNFPVVEALSHGTSVIGLRSAIIPEFEKYVNVALDLDEFENLMTRAMKKDLPPQQEINIQDFSWDNYCKKLIALYS